MISVTSALSATGNESPTLRLIFFSGDLRALKSASDDFFQSMIDGVSRALKSAGDEFFRCLIDEVSRALESASDDFFHENMIDGVSQLYL